MAKKKKRIYFLNYDVTELFANFEELSKNPQNGLDFAKMLRDIESAKGKENFQEIFRNIISENLEKVLTAQSKAIKNGTSSVKLSKVCAQFIDSMRTIEKICIDKKLLGGEALSRVFDEKKLVATMKTVAKRELKKADDKAPIDTKLKEQLDDIEKFKLDKDNTNIRVQAPKKAFKRLLYATAEKKYGSFENNKEEINKYVKSFDFKKPEAEETLKEVASLNFITRNSLGFIIDPKTGLPYIYDLNFQRFLYTGEIYWFNTKSPAADAFRERYGFHSHTYFDYCENKYFEYPMDSEEPPKKSSFNHDSIEKFYNHFGFYVNQDLLKEIFTDTLAQKEGRDVFYRQAYQDTFIKLFNRAKCNFKGICQMFCDFENIMQDTKEEFAPQLTGEKYDFGGMKPKEVKNFLTTITEDECNITKKTKNELISNCSKNGVVDVKQAVSFSKNKIQSENENQEISNEEKIANSVAALTALQQVHNDRKSGFSFFHPILYREEQRAIDELKKDILTLSNNIVPIELQNAINNGSDVYKEGYEQAIKDIDDLSVNIERVPMENLEKRTSIENNLAPVGEKLIENPNKDLVKTIEINVPGNPVLSKKND